MMNTIYHDTLTTPLGEMLICATDTGVCLLEFADQKNLARELQDLENRLNARVVQEENAYIQMAKQELQSYFEGRLTQFQTPIHFVGTPFQISVWQVLQGIQYGETISYREESMRLGNLKAIRAVAAANGKNKISIIVPCHRVIGSNGALTGYAGGLSRKQFLLNLESNNFKLL